MSQSVLGQAEAWYRWEGEDLYLFLRATPRAKRTEFGEIRNGALQLRLNAPPVDGKANKELLGYVAKRFGVSRGRVELLRGERGREKRVVVRKPARLPEALKLMPPPHST